MPIAGTPRPTGSAVAVQRHLKAREEAILPRFVSRRAIAVLWLLLAAHVGGAALASLAWVPIYASGPAVVLGESAPALSARGGEVVAVFVPPSSAARLRVGQKLVLDPGAGRHRVIARVAVVEPEVRGPAELSRRFSLTGAAAAALTRPAAVALARWSPEDGLSPAAHAGSVYRADVEVGARRAVSFLPLAGPHFGGKE